MRSWIKITIGIISSLIIVFVVGGYIMFRMLNQSLPVYEGTIRASGLRDNVEIYRDSMAVPYIFANNDEDVAFALGYLHAQERMFTMDIIRRAGEGRLSEVFGVETVPFDKMFRTIGISRIADHVKLKMNRDALKLLEAYSRGVNLYIEQARGNYTFEFDMLGYEPYEWKPEHSLIIIRMMAWELNISWWTDITFTEIVQKLGNKKAEGILPAYPENAPTIIPEHLKKYSQVNRSLLETDKAFRKFIGINGTHIGSNNWVVNGVRSSSNKSIIANDPHLAYSAPGKWYAAVIKSPGWEAAGVTLPGVPGIVIGKNQNVSWVLTNIMNDDSDFYFEKIDSSGTRYLLDGEWKNLTIINDTINVADGSVVPFTIKETHRGPIISKIYPFNYVYNDDESSYPPISMRWLGREFSDECFAFIKINKASNWNEFKSAVQMFNVPGQNFVYGDDKGNIGYIFGAAIPIRHTNSTTFIFDGTTSSTDWKGFVDRSEVPELFNPTTDYIASANNKTVKNFKYHISNLWEPSSRIDRIIELLNSKSKHSAEDFMDYQMDIKSPYSELIVKYILNAFKGIKITDNNLIVSLELLSEWDFMLDKFSQAPSIYLVTYKYLLENTYLDEMGKDLFNQYVFLANIPYRNILQLLSDQDGEWWNDITTSKREIRDEIIRKSVAQALTYLEENVGEKVEDWQWGELHKLSFKHPFSGNFSILDRYINIGPYEVGGDGTTIFNTEYSFSESIEEYPLFRHNEFENDLGPSMRYIFDFAKPNAFYLILTTGQSGNVMNDHYSDMTIPWLTGKYMKISTDQEKIKNSDNKLLILTP